MMVPELFLDEYLEDEAFVDELLGLVERRAPRQALPPARRAGAGRAVARASGALFYTVLLLACVAALFYGAGGGEAGAKPIAGFYIFNVKTGSMQRVLPQGSLVLVQKTDPDKIEVGQHITFFTDGRHDPTTHTVFAIAEDFEGSGTRGFETRGSENNASDFEITRAENVLGVVRFRIPLLGRALQYVKDHPQLVLLWFGGLLALSFFLRIAFGPKKEPEKTGDNPGFIRRNTSG